MIRINQIPIIAYMSFQLVYYCAAGSSKAWSGAWFCANSLMLLYFFSLQKGIIKLSGQAMSLSVLLFCIGKYFFEFKGERMYTLIPFVIILIGLICLHTKRRNT